VDECKPLTLGDQRCGGGAAAARQGAIARDEQRAQRHGRVVQVAPMKRTLKAPGTKLLKLKYDKPLSKFGFRFNLRRYTTGPRRTWKYFDRDGSGGVDRNVGCCTLSPSSNQLVSLNTVSGLVSKTWY
jgi:hypothetical protein